MTLILVDDRFLDWLSTLLLQNLFPKVPFCDFNISSVSADSATFVVPSSVPRKVRNYLTSILPDSGICFLCSLHLAEFSS